MKKAWVLGFLLVLALSSLAFSQARGNGEQVALSMCGDGAGNQWRFGRRLSTLDSENRAEVMSRLEAAMQAGDRQAIAEIAASLPEPARGPGNGQQARRGQGRMNGR